jgi:hypothetical protein
MLESAMNWIELPKRSARRPRTASNSRRRNGFAIALLAVAALSLSSCISSGFTYISRRSPDATILGFKLPSAWKTSDTQQYLEATNGPISTAEAKNIAQGEWIEAFSAAPRTSPDFDTTFPESKVPVGYAEARPLNADERDTWNFSSMRSEILSTDPLESSQTPDPFHVTAYSEFANTSDGIRGSRLTTNIQLASGATTTMSQIVEVDVNTNWVFAIAVGCEAGCWGPNAGEINQVLKSWSVKET